MNARATPQEERSPLRVLIVEDSADDAELLLRAVRQSGYEPTAARVETAAAMRAALHDKPWDLILSDYHIPGFGGMEALRIAKESGLDLPFIVVSGKVGEEALVEVMKAGATDFLLKGSLSRLGSLIKRELTDAAARRGMRQAQVEWRAAFDAVQDAIFIHDADFRILRANLAYAALGGLPVAQVAGKRYWEVFPLQDGPLPGCRRITEGHQGWMNDEEFTLGSGETYSSRAFAVANDRGDYLYSIHVLQDITERNRIMDAVQTSERRFRNLIENSADAFFVIDPTGKLIYRSESGTRLSGYQAEQVLGHPIMDFLVAEDIPAARRTLGEVLAVAGRIARIELRLRRRDGSVIDVEFVAKNCLDVPEVGGVVVTARDITARKRAAEAARQLGERLTTTLESITDAFLTVDLDWRFCFVNHEAERLLGRGREELIGRDMWVEFPAAIGSRFEREYRRAIAEQQSVEFEEFYAPLDTWFGIRAYPSEQGLAVYFRDVGERKRAEQVLRERIRLQEQLVRIAASVPGLIYSFQLLPNGASRMPYASGALEDIFGLKPGEVTEDAAPIFALIHAEDVGRVKDSIAESARTLNPWRSEFRLCRARQKEIWVEAHSVPQREPDGSIIWHGFLQDTTERRKAEDRIAYLNRVYAMLSSINTLIVRVRDRDELFREGCRIAVEAGGFRMAWLGVLDRRAMTIVPAASAGIDREFLAALAERYAAHELGAPEIPLATRAMRQKTVVVSNDLKNDATLAYRDMLVDAGIGSMAILPLVVADEAVAMLTLYAGESEFFRDEELKLLSELASDIAFAMEHIDRRERLDFMANYDELTGLANRSLLLDRMTQYINGAKRDGHQLAVFLVNLEHFKNINDSLGRAAGDELLRQVAQWLTRAMGNANLLARVGADHFAVVLPKVRPDGNLARLLEKWIETFMSHSFRLNDAAFRVAAKVGIAIFPDDGDAADTLFRNAEAALKAAKAGGERYLFYTRTMTATVAARVSLENQLRQALDNHEFVLHYQPKVSLASGRMTSAEALIRWNNPRSGLVPPDHFIPMLEETGLIHEVGRWVLHQAIADYLRWRSAGLPAVRIAVNVSPLQLRHRDFVAEIGQAIAIDPQAAAGLELEITESLIMEDVRRNIASLQAIRDLGVSIAIDDFGTGFSSLSYLARLPVDALKIDRSFVIDMTAGPQGLALVSTIINLAQSLKLKVVAEGVETEEQQHTLRLLDCDEMQGYLFSKPVPADIFEARFLVRLAPDDKPA